MAYDAQHLYVADPGARSGAGQDHRLPDAPRHATRRRTGSRSLIDSYHDKRTAYEFSVNPAGVKQDKYYFNDGDEDQGWDAVWDVGRGRGAPTAGAPSSASRSRSCAFRASEKPTFGFALVAADRAPERDVDVAAHRRRAPTASCRSSASCAASSSRSRPSGSSSCRTPSAICRPKPDERQPARQEREPGRVGRPRHEVRDHAGADADGDGQSRLRPGRGRSGGRQPQRVRDVLSGAPAVLRRGLGRLPLRHGLQRRQLHRPLLHAPHRPSAAARGRRPRRWLRVGAGQHDDHRRDESHRAGSAASRSASSTR